MNDDELKRLGQQLAEYCEKYLIPLPYVFEILNDQKVTPMTRGKAMEYNAYLLLREKLNAREWSIEKLNLCAGPGNPDEDISVTHKRTGVILKVESKSAVRGSMSCGTRSKICKEPHFNVKCHRSRSNIKLSGTSNDRYKEDVFDIILTNPLNALYEKGTIGECLELIRDKGILEVLYRHYNVDSGKELLTECNRDWRFVVPPRIAVEGFIPRTPVVKLTNDANWFNIVALEDALLQIVKERTGRGRSSRR